MAAGAYPSPRKRRRRGRKQSAKRRRGGILTQRAKGRKSSRSIGY